jgi:DNA-directed RNA polymerase subunit RPC12/RpoP
MGYDRNRELGDRCGFCLQCGWGRRFMGENEATMPSRCPDCGGEVLTACRECGAPIVSLMGIGCRECGAPLREPELFGVEIRRKPEKGAARHLVVDAGAVRGDNEKRSR